MTLYYENDGIRLYISAFQDGVIAGKRLTSKDES